MVNCSKCGHEFLCDREKLIPKKPFARAKKAVTVHTPKDRREAIQSALMETGLQIMAMTGPGWDHPFLSTYPEGRYLKVLWAIAL